MLTPLVETRHWKKCTSSSEALEGITASMKTKEQHDQARDLLHRKHTHKLEDIKEIFATLRRNQWDKQLSLHARTWSFKGFPKLYTEAEKKYFMFKMASFCGDWATQNDEGNMHLAALTTSGLEGEYTNKFKAGQTQRKQGQNLPSIHFQSAEEAGIFGDFVVTTANWDHWTAYSTATSTSESGQ